MGEKKRTAPRDRPLKLLFMTCSALGVKPELDFEKEEEAIFRVTANLDLDMEVEDSGSLEGLRQKLEQEKEPFDVVHLSGHADIDKHGRPFFIMEDETGGRKDVLPGELWAEALIENPPRLLFLSGCRTGEARDTIAAASFARLLVEQYQVPAVLGWGRTVGDQQATFAEEMIYKELSKGRSILQAVQRARFELAKKFLSSPDPAWPLLRLFSNGIPLNALVTTGKKHYLPPGRMKHTYLKESRVQILEQGFVGRRRHLQASLRVLLHDRDKIGLLLHGTAGLGKSCLAGKICERFSQHHLIIVHGRLNAITLEPALKDAFINSGDEPGAKILNTDAEMTEKIAKLCASSFKQKNYLMILDDFEQNLEGAESGQPGPLLPEAAQLLEVLLHYLPFSGKMTQLIITCRYLFELPREHEGVSIPGAGHRIEKLEPICLTTFQPAEQSKKLRELGHIEHYPNREVKGQLMEAGRGNPRLMEWLDILVGEMQEEEVPKLLAAVKDRQEEFIRRYVIRELVQRGGEELERFLRWLAVYRLPVLMAGVEEIGKQAGIKGWQELLPRGIELSLAEHDRAGESYGVTPLLREELRENLDDNDTRSCHRAAFTYYQNLCQDREGIDPVPVEEWIYHALGCGEEETASKQGGRLVSHLCNRLAFRESCRVGEWILAGKNSELSTGDDAFLLNALGSTIYFLGDHRKAIDYYEQALVIDEARFGKEHPNVARELNNLGSTYFEQGKTKKAKHYLQRAFSIFKKFYGDEHPHTRTVKEWLDACE